MRDKEKKLKTPVLFLIFNRPSTTKRVFEEIKKAKPTKLYIAADGPRNQEEKKKTEEVREIVSKINWPCKIKKLYRDKNLGCKYGVSSAIDWFFKNEKQGIILEDDCLPSQSFFRFCQEMLKKYERNKRIMHISGTNVEGISETKEDYFFSKTFNVWGWATWKRAWKKYDVGMKKWPRYKNIRGMKKLGYSNFSNIIKSKRILSLTHNGKIDTWDYQWDFTCRINKSFSVIPSKNLITNLGFDEGTHTVKTWDKKKVLIGNSLKFPLKENRDIIPSQNYYNNFIKFFQGKIIIKLLNKLLNKK